MIHTCKLINKAVLLPQFGPALAALIGSEKLEPHKGLRCY